MALDAVIEDNIRSIADIEDFAADRGTALATMCHCPEGACVFY